MLHRHRVPTIFSIYMLDVICCALGCVVLLWQVAHQEADEQTAKANRSLTAAELARVKFETSHEAYRAAAAEVADLKSLLAILTDKNRKVSISLAETEKEREAARILASARQDEIDKTRKSLSLSEDQLRKLEDDLAKLLATNKKTTADLTGQVKINTELLAKIALAEKQVTALKSDIANKVIDIDLGTKKYQEQIVLFKLSEDNARKLQKLLDSVRDDNKDATTKLKLTELQLKVRDQELEKFRTELKDLLASRDKLGKEAAAGVNDLAYAKKQINLLTAERDLWKEKSLASSKELISERDLWKAKSVAVSKELASTTIAFGALKDEKNKLSQRVVDLQAEADQRFAGVPLTGESIVFMIDVSGSMIMKDAKTPDPDKWPFLCETLMQLMKSIPSMRRFQVILFSDKVDYLFGNRDYWMKYEGPQTAVAARDKLKKFDVGGNTNMHDAFDEAFRYRKQGMDTIYLFSDGLPNVGDGLPPNIRTPSEAELSYHLGKHVRDKLKNDWNRPLKGRDPVRINAIGFFFESPDVGAFLWALARDHRGNFAGVR